MRIRLLWASALTLVFLLSACGGPAAVSPDTSFSPEPEPSSDGGSPSPSPTGVGKPLLFSVNDLFVQEMPDVAAVTIDGELYISIYFIASVMGYEFGWHYDENLYVIPSYADTFLDGAERDRRPDTDCNYISIIGPEYLFYLTIDSADAAVGPHNSEYAPFRLQRPVITANSQAYLYIKDAMVVFNARLIEEPLGVVMLTADRVWEETQKTIESMGFTSFVRDGFSAIFNRPIAQNEEGYFIVFPESKTAKGPYSYVHLMPETLHFFYNLDNTGYNGGVLDLDGNEIIPAGINFVNIHYPSWNYITAVRSGNTSIFGMCSMDGREIIPAKYESIGSTSAEQYIGLGLTDYSTLFDGTCVAAMLEGKWGVVSLDGGSAVIPFEFDDVGTLVEEYDEVWDATSSWVLNEISPLGAVIVSKDGKWGALKKDGSVAVPIEYDRIYAEVSETSYTYMGERNGVPEKLA